MLLGPTIVRSEAHALRCTPELRADVQRTIVFYRRVVRMLATVAITHWPELGRLDTFQKPMAFEALFHPTARRAVVRYAVVSKVLGKMPSYLRRAALSHALGLVSSFLSNYDLWLEGTIGGKKRDIGDRPPRLGFSNVFPSLYGGNMIEVGVLPATRVAIDKAKADKFAKKKEKFELEFVGPKLPIDPDTPEKPAYVWKSQIKKSEESLTPGMVRIKILNAKGQWAFSCPIKLRGKRKRLPLDGSMPMSPSLIMKGAKVWLGCPVELRPPRYLTNAAFNKVVDGQSQRVCAVDVGINTAAAVCIVDKSGTVINRKFFTCDRHNDQRDRLQAVIRFKQQKSGGTVKGTPFCADLHRRIEGLSKDAARRIASEIAAFAQANGAKAIVIEDLKGWRPKGPSKAMRARFHRFQHRMIAQALTHKAQELGMRLLEIQARGTSRWAYDGSGKVSRSRQNAQNATFANGRQYNADLNASYNIAARGLAMILGIKNPREEVKKDVKIIEAGTGKSTGPVLRMPIVLFDVWEHHRLKSLAGSKPLKGTSNPAGLVVVCQQ